MPTGVGWSVRQTCGAYFRRARYILSQIELSDYLLNFTTFRGPYEDFARDIGSITVERPLQACHAGAFGYKQTITPLGMMIGFRLLAAR